MAITTGLTSNNVKLHQYQLASGSAQRKEEPECMRERRITLGRDELPLIRGLFRAYHVAAATPDEQELIPTGRTPSHNHPVELWLLSDSRHNVLGKSLARERRSYTAIDRASAWGTHGGPFAGW